MGAQNWALARKLHRSACQAAFFLTLLCVSALAIGGKRIFGLWTRHRIVMDVHAFYLLLGVVLLNSAWSASSAALLAANKHQRVAVLYLVFTVGSILVGYPLIRAFGLVGAGIARLACEGCMDVIVVKTSNNLLSDRWPAFSASMLDFSHFNLPRLRPARWQATQD